jgi:NAD(P)-dependent dehydrogenase (short-subunit alcohol dehydrogenase family)
MTIALRGLEGKKVLVTGGAKGQGYSHVMAFADAGCEVAALDITTPIDDIYACATQEMLDQTVADIENRGARGIGLSCDLRDEDQVAAAVNKALDFFGGEINVLVNNAGIAALDPIHQMRSSTLHAIIDTNLKGTMFATKYASDNMIARREGKIINISSGATGCALANLSHYSATKHAINGLTQSWAMELAEFNINVNAICPATIRPGEGQGSGMVLGLAPEVAPGMSPEEAYVGWCDLNMPGEKWRCEARHITDMVVFLASENAEMVTGSIIPVDCGMMAR